jgi:hypothetical protein
MDTVSLNNDLSNVDMEKTLDSLESQSSALPNNKKKLNPTSPSNISETEDESDREMNPEIVVVVEKEQKIIMNTGLRPLNIQQKLPNAPRRQKAKSQRDYVDRSLFSPEVSRHSLEVAQRRAKILALELKEEEEVRAKNTLKNTRLTATDALSVITGAIVNSLYQVKKIVGGSSSQYDLLTGSSSSNNIEDLDADGDGIQLSPEAKEVETSIHFLKGYSSTNSNSISNNGPIRPALKRISAYSAVGKEKKEKNNALSKPRKSIQWISEVIEQEDEYKENEEEEEEEQEQESSSLVHGKKSPLMKKISRKKNKERTGGMRRLTPKEKEELYKERPDLQIIPNWAQKYREEMSETESVQWGFWLILFIVTLVVLLIVLIALIVQAKPHN